MYNTLKERIEYILFVTKMKHSSMEQLTGVPASVFSEIKRGKIVNLNKERADAISKAFPQFTSDWIMNGESNPDNQTFNVSMGDNSQVGGSGNIYNAGADAAELASLRAENSELKAENDTLRKEVAEKDKTIARLEGKIEIYKEMVNK